MGGVRGWVRGLAEQNRALKYAAWSRAVGGGAIALATGSGSAGAAREKALTPNPSPGDGRGGQQLLGDRALKCAAWTEPANGLPQRGLVDDSSDVNIVVGATGSL